MLALISLAGCGGAPSNAGDPSVRAVVSTISVSPAASSIRIGATRQLQATAKDQDGNVIAGMNFVFLGSGSVATVSSAGLVKGISAGTVTITASADGKSASASITVVPVTQIVTQISVSPSTASIQAGQAQSYTAMAYDQFNQPVNGINFTWASDSSASIATLSGNIATGVSPGTAHITASASGISSTAASLTVLPPPPALTTIAVSPASPSIFTGAIQQLTAVGYDQSGNQMTGIVFGWTSANPSVATVDHAGLATGVAVGASQISASAQGVNSNAISLTVNRPLSVLTSITLSPSTASIQAGDTQQFTAVGNDQYGVAISGMVFTWGSSVAKVASVDGVNSEGKNDGVATGLAAGSTVITVSANGVHATASLNVTAPPPPPPPPAVNLIHVVPGNVSINPGGTQQFSALATDQNGLAMSNVLLPGPQATPQSQPSTPMAWRLAWAWELRKSVQGLRGWSAMLYLLLPHWPIPAIRWPSTGFPLPWHSSEAGI